MKSLSESISYRRSVRLYKQDQEIDTQIVKKCIAQATLSPNSSNLQLWQFIHVTDPGVLKKMAVACMGQNAAKTAKQMVVIVTRKDWFREHAKLNKKFVMNGEEDYAKLDRRQKLAADYYGKLIPIIYSDWLFGLFGIVKYWAFQLIGLFRVSYRQTRRSDLRVIVHKTAALAAQTFMLSMASHSYDTCPMEGSDTLRIKKILGLPAAAEINMIISCGIRDKGGVYGSRYRVPFEKVYQHV